MKGTFDNSTMVTGKEARMFANASMQIGVLVRVFGNCFFVASTFFSKIGSKVIS